METLVTDILKSEVKTSLTITLFEFFRIYDNFILKMKNLLR